MEGLNQEERSKLIRSVGTHQGARPLSPIEVGQLFAKALVHNSPDDVAREVEFRGATMVSRFVRLLALPEEFQPLVDWGTSEGSIPFSAASAVGGLPLEIQRSLLNLLLADQLDTQSLRQVVPIIRKGQSVEAAVREAGKLRPIVVRRHLLIGAVARGDQERVRSLGLSSRDSVIRSAVSGLLSPTDLTSARLLPDRFTVVTNDAGKASIDEKAREAKLSFEHLIQGRIRKELVGMTP